MKKTFSIIKASIMVGATLSLLGAYTSFAATPTIVSAKITGPNTVTIVFSENVITHKEDYDYFTGALLNRSLLAISGNGTNTIVLTFDGLPMSAGSTANLHISVNTLSTSNTMPFEGGNVTIEDGQGGSSNSSSSSGTTSALYYTLTSTATRASLRPGDTITFNLRPVPEFPKPGATVTGSYNGVTLSWRAIAGGESYEAIYTVGANDPSQTTPLQITDVVLTDSSGVASVKLSSHDVSSLIDTTTVVISEKTPIASPADPLHLDYTFNTNRAGTINFGGDCLSLTAGALSGDNTIRFKELPNGTYDNCVISVTDYSGKTSNILKVSPFAIGSALAAAAPAVVATAPAIPPTPAPATVSTTASFLFTTQLSTGTSGTEVTELQKLLSSLGFLTVAPTGFYGSLTASAVSQFQAAHGLPTVGRVGPATLALLNGINIPSTNSVTTPASTPAPYSSGNYQFTRYLSLSSSGDDVTELQKRLASEGLYFGATTGTFTPLTQAGVMIYQAKHGLEPVGVVGPGTRALLNQ